MGLPEALGQQEAPWWPGTDLVCVLGRLQQWPLCGPNILVAMLSKAARTPLTSPCPHQVSLGIAVDISSPLDSMVSRLWVL